MRRKENKAVRVELEWKPQGERSRGKTRKSCIDVVGIDLKILGNEEWKEVVQDRLRWRNVVIAAKTLREL